MALHPLKGSERQPLPGAKSVGKADPAERLEVSVLLRRRSGTALTEHVKKLTSREKSDRHLSREEFERQFGADNAQARACACTFAGWKPLPVPLRRVTRLSPGKRR